MPIAIVGMACRFPGEATSPSKLWKLVSEKRAAWSEMPKERMNVDSFYHPDGERAGNVSFFCYSIILLARAPDLNLGCSLTAKEGTSLPKI